MSGPASGAVASSTSSPEQREPDAPVAEGDLEVTQQGVHALAVDAAQRADLPAGERSLGHEQERLDARGTP